MNTNLNQLLKDLEISTVHIRILICFLGCAFMLYPTLFYFTRFFRELSVYEQLFFALGSSALYIGFGLPLSMISPMKYPKVFYLPLVILPTAVIASLLYIFLGDKNCNHFMAFLYSLSGGYLLNFITGVISICREKNHPKNDIYY